MIREIEHKAIHLLLDGDDPILAALRNRYKNACVVSQELTGVGVYMNYSVLPSWVNLPRDASFCFGDIEGQIDPLHHGVGFLLWVRNGELSCLEMYTYDEPWPDEIISFHLDYIGGNRDLSKTRKVWS